MSDKKSNTKPRALVTGGCGFLGSYLCDYLIESGHAVWCVDNLYTGQKQNVSHLIDQPDFKLIEHDIVMPLKLEVDVIFNMACPASPVHYQSDPVKTVKTNVMGAINMLEMATEQNTKIVQASTSEVYGDPIEHPQTESYWGNVNPIGHRSCYDEGKRCAETLFFDFNRQFNTPIKVARIFNTYGPRMHPNDGRVVSNFIVQALQGQSLTVFGQGKQTRSFCFVDDLIAGLIALADSPDDFIGPVNLGNPVETDMLQLAEKIIELTGSKSKIEFRPLPFDDPKHRNPDISLAREKLGWQPVTSLADGLAKTVNYFDKLLTA